MKDSLAESIGEILAEQIAKAVQASLPNMLARVADKAVEKAVELSVQKVIDNKEVRAIIADRLRYTDFGPVVKEACDKMVRDRTSEYAAQLDVGPAIDRAVRQAAIGEQPLTKAKSSV